MKFYKYYLLPQPLRKALNAIRKECFMQISNYYFAFLFHTATIVFIVTFLWYKKWIISQLIIVKYNYFFFFFGEKEQFFRAGYMQLPIQTFKYCRNVPFNAPANVKCF